MVKIPRQFPRRLDDIIPTATVEKLLDVLQQPDIAGKVREALHKVGLQDAAPLDKFREAWQQARGWIDSVAESVTGGASHPRVLNASGQILSSSLSAIPWGATAAYEFAKAATDYQSSASLQRQVDDMVGRLFGSYESAWLGSTAEALRILSSGPVGSEGIIVSRVDAVRIAGLGDVRSMLQASANRLLDIGAANGVRTEEWKAALTGSRQLVVLSSPNNLSLEDASQHRLNALAAAKACGAAVIEVLADGTVNHSLAEHYAFPSVQHSLETGADVVILPTQLLTAGPAGAFVVGEAKLLAPLKLAAENIGVLLNGAALAGAASALRTAATPGGAPDKDNSSAVASLLVNPANLRNRAQRLAIQLAGRGEIGEAHEVELTAPLGPSPWNRYQLKSWGVRLQPRNSLADLSRQISRGENKLGLKLELIREAECLAVNLRFVPPPCDHELVQLIAGDGPESDQETNGSPPN